VSFETAARRGAPILFLTLALVAAALFAGRFGAEASLRADGAACPRISEAAKLPLRPGGGRLRGDVDGDGALDQVSVRYAPRSRASCGFLLVVKTHSRVLAVTAPEWYKPPQDLRIRDWWPAEPFLAAIVRLDPHRDQIVVARSRGASVVSVSVYGVVGGKLLPLHVHRAFYQDTLLPLGGTVGTGDTNARCVRGGPLILLSRGPTSATGSRWFVTRSEYRLIKNRFWRVRTRTVRSSMRRVDALARRWGMDALPFTGCTVAHGRRL
jgi:hypothetical protein